MMFVTKKIHVNLVVSEWPFLAIILGVRNFRVFEVLEHLSYMVCALYIVFVKCQTGIQVLVVLSFSVLGITVSFFQNNIQNLKGMKEKEHIIIMHRGR